MKKSKLELYTDASIKEGVTSIAYVILLDGCIVSQQRVSFKVEKMPHEAELLASELGLYYVSTLFDRTKHKFTYYTDSDLIIKRKGVKKPDKLQLMSDVITFLRKLEPCVVKTGGKSNLAHKVARGECWMLY